VADLVDRGYTAETAKRWRHQRRNLQAAAAAAGLPCSETALGLFQIAGKKGAALCMANTLPLDAAAFMRLDDIGPTETPVLFGPLEAQGRVGRSATAWLDKKSSIAARDEGRMLRTMFRLKRGARI
jgi:hypothetical protein